MMRDDRRVQEGARDLAIAFNIGRAEEALYRIRKGASLGDQDLRFFKLLGDLFSQALKGSHWIESALSGTATAVSPDALKAFQLVLPVITSSATASSAADFLSELLKVTMSIVAGTPLPQEERDQLSSILKELSKSATRSGMDALEPRAVPSSFSILPRVQNQG
jgi:hypothetical protein